MAAANYSKSLMGIQEQHVGVFLNYLASCCFDYPQFAKYVYCWEPCIGQKLVTCSEPFRPRMWEALYHAEIQSPQSRMFN